MALTVTNKKSVQIAKSDFETMLTDYLRNNHVSPSEEITVTLLVDKAAFANTPDSDSVVQISWEETDDA